MSGTAATLLLNAGLYQAGWLALAHLALVERRGAEARLVALVALGGTAVDSAQQAAGTLAFPSGHYLPRLCPAWLTVLWAQFATLPCNALSWLAGRPAACAVLGAAGGPLAFLAGERLGGGDLPRGEGDGVRGAGRRVGRRLPGDHGRRGALRRLPGAVPLATRERGGRGRPAREVRRWAAG